MHPFVHMDEMAGIEANIEERVVNQMLDRSLQFACRNAQAQRFIPGHDAAEVGACKLFDIVPNIGRQILRPGRQKPAAAGQVAFQARGHGKRLAALHFADRRACQAIFCARASR